MENAMEKAKGAATQILLWIESLQTSLHHASEAETIEEARAKIAEAGKFADEIHETAISVAGWE